MAPKQPSRHDYRFWVSINSINSVPCFGTDQTAVQGLKLTETSKSTKNGNKTQVGRESYLKEFEELPIPESTRSLSRVERFSFSPRRPPTVGSPGILERSQRLSLEKPPFPFLQSYCIPFSCDSCFCLCSFKEKKHYLLIWLFPHLTIPTMTFMSFFSQF